MDFNDGITVLTDFGTSYCWGLNSPIYDIGEFIPLIMTYSHYHEDHYDPDRIPPGVTYTLDLMDSLNIMDLWIRPVRTCESTPGVESNTSFIFDYMGFRICHLGDAQAEIMNIEDPAQQALILEKFPDRIDLLLMTIEGVYPFIPEAEKFIDLLQPGVVVPMHYWSPEYKEEFLAYLELQNVTAGKLYDVFRNEGPMLDFMVSDTIHENIKVFGLCPSPYGETGIEVTGTYSNDIKVFPNPCREDVNISFYSEQREVVICTVYDINGRQINKPQPLKCNEGRNVFTIDMAAFPDGIYLLQLKSVNLELRNAYVLRRSQ